MKAVPIKDLNIFGSVTTFVPRTQQRNQTLVDFKSMMKQVPLSKQTILISARLVSDKLSHKPIITKSAGLVIP